MRASTLTLALLPLLAACGSANPDEVIDTVRATEQAQMQAIAADDLRGATRNYETGAEVLVLPNYTDDSIAQATQARELGLDQPIIGGDGWIVSRVAPLPAFDGAYFSQHWTVGLQSEANQAFVETYSATYGHEPRTSAALTYDSLRLLFAAMQREGASDPEAIQRGLAATGG